MTLEEAVQKAWQLLVHPDCTTTPMMAVDWIQEQSGCEGVQEVVSHLWKEAANWVEEKFVDNDSDWTVSPKKFISTIRDGSFTPDYEDGLCSSFNEFIKHNLRVYKTYLVWMGFQSRVQEVWEIMSTIVSHLSVQAQ